MLERKARAKAGLVLLATPSVATRPGSTVAVDATMALHRAIMEPSP